MKLSRRRAGSKHWAALGLTAVAAAASAQAASDPLTNPLPVVGGNQAQVAAVASDPAGNLLVLADDLVTHHYAVQRFTAVGTLPGPEIEIPTVSPGASALIATNAAGQYVIAWAQYESTSSDYSDIYVQAFDASDQPMSAPVPVASKVRFGIVSSAAMDSAGNYFVTWVQDRSVQVPCPGCFDTFEAFTVWTRSYKPDGTANTNAIEVARTPYFHDSGLRYFTTAHTSVDSQGNFLIGWNYSTYKAAYLVAQRFKLDGSRSGLRMQLETAPSESFSVSSVSMNAAGSIAASWILGNEVMAQVFESNGHPASEPIPVTSVSANQVSNADVSITAKGDFVVKWQESPVPADSPSHNYAQWFDVHGYPKGAPLSFAPGRVNANGKLDQVYLGIATDASDHLLTAWTYSHDGTNGSTQLGYVQAFSAP